MKRSQRKNILLATAVAAALVRGGIASADVHTWNGSTDNQWNTASNWSSGAVPSGTLESVVFYAPGAPNLNIDATTGAAGFTIGSMTFNTDATSPVTLTVSTAKTLTINGGTGDDVIVQTGSHVISGAPATSGVELKLVSTDFNIATGATLDLHARINQGSSGNSYTLGGGGTLILSAQNGSTGGWNFTGGGFVLNSGVLVMKTTQAVGNSGNKLTVNNGAVLQFEASSYVATNGALTVNNGGTLRSLGGGRRIDNGTGALVLNGTANIEVVDNTFTLNQDITGSGGFTKLGNGVLVLNDGGTGAVSNYTGRTVVQAGTLSLGATGSTGSSPVIDVRSGAAFDVTAASSYTVQNNTALGGNGTVYGNTTLGTSGTIAPGLQGTAGTLTFNNDLNLNSGQLQLDLATPGPVGSGVNDLLVVNGNLNLTGATALTINRLGGSLSAGSYTVLQYTGALSGNASNFVAPVVRQGLTVDTNTANQINLVLGAGSAADLLWKGDGSSNAWQTNGANVWLNGATADKYFDWDNVTFSDDHGSNSTSIDVNGFVVPNNVTINASSAYSFGGSGTISGVNTLTKSGSGTSSFSNTGGVNAGTLNLTGGALVFTNNSNIGATTISAGRLAIGDGASAGTIGTGAVSNNGWVELNNPGDAVYANSFSGSGTIEKKGGGVATFSGNNSGHTGEILVSSGTLKANNNNALAAGAGTLTVANGAVLDLAGGAAGDSLSFGAKVFHISGSGAGGTGAITNSGTTRQFSAFQFITLDADATMGGFRFDIGRNGTGNVLDLAGHKLTLNFTGTQPMFGVETNATITSGTIEVAAGALDLERTAVVHADGAGSNIIFDANTNLQLFETAAGGITRPLVFNGGNLIGPGSSNTATVDSPILLQGNVTLQNQSNGIGNTTGTGTLVLNGPITENGGAFSITKVNANAAVLGAVNTYTGGTNVNAGTLIVLNTGRIGTGPLTVAASALTDIQAGAPVASKVAALSIAGGGTVDLHDNDMVVGSATPTADVVAGIRNARNNGNWDQSGLTSTEARVNANHNTTLGVLTGADYSSAGGSGVFSGQSYTASDTLVKYTYYGDTDFNGRVNFDDYVRTDNGFNNHLTGWLNGDFDYNNVVNFDDYVLIDLAFNTQSGTLSRALALIDGSDTSGAGMDDPALRQVQQHLSEFGAGYARSFLSAVPEPTAVGALIGLAGPALLARRRRRGGQRM